MSIRNWFSYLGRENIAMLDLLIRSGANVNSSNVNADTPLHISAHLGYEKTIEKLIENGAEIEARNSEYKTPLFLAVLTGKYIMSKRTCSKHERDNM